jgi:hypothetical protein
MDVKIQKNFRKKLRIFYTSEERVQWSILIKWLYTILNSELCFPEHNNFRLDIWAGSYIERDVFMPPMRKFSLWFDFPSCQNNFILKGIAFLSGRFYMR